MLRFDAALEESVRGGLHVGNEAAGRRSDPYERDAGPAAGTARVRRATVSWSDVTGGVCWSAVLQRASAVGCVARAVLYAPRKRYIRLFLRLGLGTFLSRLLVVAKCELDIEEYSFSQTTLEQVFLKFAHYDEVNGEWGSDDRRYDSNCSNEGGLMWTFANLYW